MKNRDFRPKREPEVYRATPPTEAAGDVGDSYSVTYERHKTQPKLWRLRERRVLNGEVFENATDWAEFHKFSPALGMQHGRQQAFVLPQYGYRKPELIRRG